MTFHALAVHTDMQGKGLGRALVAEIAARASG